MPRTHRPRRRGRRTAALAGIALVLGALTVAVVQVRGELPAAADAHAFGDPIFSADARGDLTTIGNVTTTCDPTYTNANWSAAESAAACNGAVSGATGLTRYDGAAMPPINNRLSMRFVDVDGDPVTFASSSAVLQIPDGAEVLWAGLHWNAATSVPDAEQLYGSTFSLAPPATSERFQVRLRTPGSAAYRTLDAAPADGTTRDTWDDVNPGGTVSYGAFVDVTDLVQEAGEGSYTVADVQSCRGLVAASRAGRSPWPSRRRPWHPAT